MVDLSYIVAVKGQCPYLGRLIESIKKQEESSLRTELLVVNGGCDYIPDSDMRVIQSDDFGIYHALNIGIKESFGKYYVVAGQDDCFSSDFERSISSWVKRGDLDLISGAVQMDSKIVYPQRKSILGFDVFKGIVACHSLGMVIKKSLHDDFGYYSNRYPVCADRHFVRSIKSKVDFVLSNDVFGEYNTGGTSAQLGMQSLCEQFVIASEGEKIGRKFFFLLILVSKLLKFWLK